jgi:hypothetical protein
MTTLQDIMGLITKRKIKTPTDNDYIISAAYTDTQERLKPQPKMEASLLSIAGIKKHILASIAPAKYKVFTALLTQRGGNNPYSVTEGNGDLTIGKTYQITEQLGGGWDFTNVGAPNNDLNTWFVATGTTPNSWGIDGSLYVNDGAPVAIVLENTIGNIWFTYVDAGGYSVVSDNLFVDNKTFINVTHFPAIEDLRIRFTFRKSSDPALIDLVTVKSNETPSDDLLLNTPIEIRVYN